MKKKFNVSYMFVCTGMQLLLASDSRRYLPVVMATRRSQMGPTFCSWFLLQYQVWYVIRRCRATRSRAGTARATAPPCRAAIYGSRRRRSRWRHQRVSGGKELHQCHLFDDGRVRRGGLLPVQTVRWSRGRRRAGTGAESRFFGLVPGLFHREIERAALGQDRRRVVVGVWTLWGMSRNLVMMTRRTWRRLSKRNFERKRQKCQVSKIKLKRRITSVGWG